MHELSEGEVITKERLEDLLNDPTLTESGPFSITGSVLDYRIDEYARVLTGRKKGREVQYKIDLEWPEEFPEDNISQERSRVQDSFLRTGIARHTNLTEIMERLRMQDDVIIGLDTNVLWDCLMTSVLLEEIYEEPFPNWILIAVPKLVMAETENAANNTFGGSHPRAGKPVYTGRIGQRALQEIMDIREPNPDRPGIAMITVGEINQGADIDRNNWKLDASIRDQFQTFLDDISFHKGTFFLSQDRVNVMMSGTEGADGLYLQKPDLTEFQSQSISEDQFTQLVYELCTQFGTIRINNEETGSLLELSVFWPGKQVSDWRDSKVAVTSCKTLI